MHWSLEPFFLVASILFITCMGMTAQGGDHLGFCPAFYQSHQLHIHCSCPDVFLKITQGVATDKMAEYPDYLKILEKSYFISTRKNR